jgi:hypothetical protein
VSDDGKKSEWLYFIKSVCISLSCNISVYHVAKTYFKQKSSTFSYFSFQGSCEVLKKLKNVKARKSSQIKRKPDPITEIVLPELGGGPGLHILYL